MRRGHRIKKTQWWDQRAHGEAWRAASEARERALSCEFARLRCSSAPPTSLAAVKAGRCARAGIDVHPFKDWLPDDAFPTIYRNANLNCSDKIQGPDREAFKRLTEAVKSATPQEMRQQFCSELMSVAHATAGEMWLEFKAAMSGDLKQGGANPEARRPA